MRIRVVVLCLFVVSGFAATTAAQTLYGAVPGANSPLYVINPATGEYRAVGNIGFGVTGLAFHPITGDLYGVTAGAPAGDFSRYLIRINRTTGAGTIVGPLLLSPTGAGVADIAFRADGTLFGWSEAIGGDDLVTINLTTGQGTVVGNAGLITRGSGLAFNRAGTLYFAGQNGNGPLRTVNTATGLTTVVATLSGAPYPGLPIPAMKFHPVTDELWSVSREAGSLTTAPVYLTKINTATGVITKVAATVARLDALAWSPRDTRVLDFDRDTHDDLLLRDFKTGDVSVMLTDGTTVKRTRGIAAAGPVWQVAGIGDLDGDGKADIVARYVPSGDVWVMPMDGAALRASPQFVAKMPLAFQIAGVGDLDGDGNADIVARQTQTGDVGVWLMSGATRLAEKVIATGVPLQWTIQGMNDLDGDGRADIVLRHSQTGDVAVALMNGGTILGVSYVTGIPLAWRIAGVDDLDGDGNADIVWQHTAGDVGVTMMDGATVLQKLVIVTSVPAGWQILKVQDLDGDGNADIVARHVQTGDFAIAFMNGATVRSVSFVSGLPLAAEIQ